LEGEEESDPVKAEAEAVGDFNKVVEHERDDFLPEGEEFETYEDMSWLRGYSHLDKSDDQWLAWMIKTAKEMVELNRLINPLERKPLDLDLVLRSLMRLNEEDILNQKSLL